jgi:DNA ligase-1
MKTFPTLYQKTNTGAIQQWRIWVVEAVEAGVGVVGNIWTEYGQVNGKLQETVDIIREGKNPGKRNATTPLEQAEKEAEAKWKKKIAREGYVEDLERARAGERDAEGGLAVMLAPTKMQERHLRFPLDVQPKLDGVRCVAIIEDGQVSLWSRRRERMSCLPHIEAAYAQAYATIPGRFVFDGEAYRHGWALQKISTFVRKKNDTRPGYEEITHNVYDMPSAKGDWQNRRNTLRLAVLPEGPVRRVETRTVASLEEAWAYHDEKVAEGYEGAMARNLEGLYEEDRRSPNLNKLKTFEDHEFKIVGVQEGRGRYQGKAIFTCVDSEGRTFECTAPGTLEDKARYLAEFERYRGQLLTVKHKGYTADGLPWHPVGKAVRDYE